MNLFILYWVSNVYMYNKCEFVFCILVYYKYYLIFNLINKGGNFLVFFIDICYIKIFDECNNSNICVYVFMKFKLMIINCYVIFE